MSCTPRGVGEPVARRDEHGASAATSERSEDVSSIDWYPSHIDTMFVPHVSNRNGAPPALKDLGTNQLIPQDGLAGPIHATPRRVRGTTAWPMSPWPERPGNCNELAILVRGSHARATGLWCINMRNPLNLLRFSINAEKRNVLISLAFSRFMHQSR
jgi:hypothetical protein